MCSEIVDGFEHSGEAGPFRHEVAGAGEEDTFNLVETVLGILCSGSHLWSSLQQRILFRERAYSPTSTPELDLNFLEVTYRWADVQSSRGYNYLYPTVVSPYMKEQYCRPAVYRWMVWTPGYGMHAYYVGETDDLARRILHCLRPGNTQTTNLRLKAYFDEAVNQKQQVELQTLAFEPFQMNKVNFSMDLLGHTLIRRILENLVLVWLDAEKSSGAPLILNRVLAQDKERSNKRIDSALSHLKHLGLTDEKTSRLLEALKIKRA